MPLETNRCDGREPGPTKWVSCSLCSYEFDHKESRPEHFLDEHEPEDAGLTPLGEVNPDADEDLFVSIDDLPEPWSPISDAPTAEPDPDGPVTGENHPANADDVQDDDQEDVAADEAE